MSKMQMIQIDKDRLLKEIEVSGMSQPEIARRLQLNYQALNRNINAGQLSAPVLYSVAALLDVSPEWITGKSDIELNFYGYQRGQAINNEESIMKNLFVLVGWNASDYDKMRQNEKDYLLTDINELVSWHVMKSKKLQGLDKDNSFESLPLPD